jgi:RimJ/RimL family protein N-acetyltransferase
VLRPWQEKDLPVLTEIRNDILLQSQLMVHVRGSSQAQTREWAIERSTKPNGLLFIIADKLTDVCIGYLQFVEIELIERKAKFGICLEKDPQREGLGRELLSLALNYLHNNFAIRKMYLEVLEENSRAIKCYEKLGFTTCGKYHQHFFLNNKWHDAVLMEFFFNE